MIFTANEYRGLFLNSIIDEDGNIPAESQVDQLPAFDVVVQARAPRDLDEAREWTRLFFRGVEILNQGDGTEVPHLPEPGVLVPPSEKQLTYIADSIDYGLLRNIDSNINQDDNTNMGVINFEL